MLLDSIEGGEALRGYRAVLLPAMIALISVVGLVAALGPAGRGLRIDPIDALNAE